MALEVAVQRASTGDAAGEEEMKLRDIIHKAFELGIVPADKSAADLIRSIQRAEGHQECFDTGRAVECGQRRCLWLRICH